MRSLLRASFAPFIAEISLLINDLASCSPSSPPRSIAFIMCFVVREFPSVSCSAVETFLDRVRVSIPAVLNSLSSVFITLLKSPFVRAAYSLRVCTALGASLKASPIFFAKLEFSPCITFCVLANAFASLATLSRMSFAPLSLLSALASRSASLWLKFSP